MSDFKEYRKTATVKAKVFEEGDQDGFLYRHGINGAVDDGIRGCKPDMIPYISTLENQYHRGDFDLNYLCVGINGERWLVGKDIFEKTYELV